MSLTSSSPTASRFINSADHVAERAHQNGHSSVPLVRGSKYSDGSPNRRQREQPSGLFVRVCLIVADLNCFHCLKIQFEIDLIKPIRLQTGLFASGPMPRPTTTNFRDRFGHTQQNPALMQRVHALNGHRGAIITVTLALFSSLPHKSTFVQWSRASSYMSPGMARKLTFRKDVLPTRDVYPSVHKEM